MKNYVVFNKPYNVVSSFTLPKTLQDNRNPKRVLTLAPFFESKNLPKDLYSAGRLDAESEGLLLITNDGNFINHLASGKIQKKYWCQIVC